jgi:two-component system sensor histidine kinase PhoQ
VLWAAATPLEQGARPGRDPGSPVGESRPSPELQEAPLLFTVLETADPVEAEVRSYRGSLLLWLGGSALLLVACQGAILAWGLRPLRELAADIDRIESGATDQLGGPYPREVQALTDSLDTLLQSEKARRERVRNTLADLAHSLKTPLAVIRGADPGEAGYGALVREQAGRMDQIVSYQLQRAAGSAHRLLQLVPVLPVAQRLRASLLKVYADRSLDIELAIEPACRFRGDERDLMEVLGNLMDNACKYGRSRVRVVAVEGEQLAISVEDDGPGIPPERRSAILQRGMRADLQREGQGIGLAVAADIVARYGGELAIAAGELGGARIDLRVP